MKYTSLILILFFNISTICLAGKTHDDWRKFQLEIDRVNSDEYEQESEDDEQRKKKSEWLKNKILDLKNQSENEKVIVNKKILDWGVKSNKNIDVLTKSIDELMPEELFGRIRWFGSLAKDAKKFIDDNLTYYTSLNRKIYKSIDKYFALVAQTDLNDPETDKRFKHIQSIAKERYEFAARTIHSISTQINEKTLKLFDHFERNILTIKWNNCLNEFISLMLMLKSLEIKPIDFSRKTETEAFLSYAAKEVIGSDDINTSPSLSEGTQLDTGNVGQISEKGSVQVTTKESTSPTWEIVIPKKLHSKLAAEFEHKNQTDAFVDLIDYLKTNGPKIKSKDLLSGRWRNYGLLNQNLYHCHLGTSQKVVVWKAFPEENRIVFYYIGKHPNDNYKQIKKALHM